MNTEWGLERQKIGIGEIQDRKDDKEKANNVYFKLLLLGFIS